MDLNTIYNENCLDTMKRMPDNFLDLTVTSPPYNVDLGNNKYNKSGYDLYSDNKPHKEYLEWLRQVFTMLFSKTKKGGRCVINIGDKQNGRVTTHSDIIQIMQSIGWVSMGVIIWDKQNTGNRTSWGSFNSPSSPSFPCPFEYILCFAKEDIKLQYKGDTDLTKDEFIKWSLASWNFPTEKLKKVGHPAAFPIDLPLRCIKMLSWINSIIYDPFMGSGTTALACATNNRNYIGSEISAEYCEIIQKRLSKIPIM